MSLHRSASNLWAAVTTETLGLDGYLTWWGPTGNVLSGQAQGDTPGPGWIQNACFAVWISEVSSRLPASISQLVAHPCEGDACPDDELLG